MRWISNSALPLFWMCAVSRSRPRRKVVRALRKGGLSQIVRKIEQRLDTHRNIKDGIQRVLQFRRDSLVA